MLLAGYGVTNVSEYAVPLWVGMLAGIAIACVWSVQWLSGGLHEHPADGCHADSLVCGQGDWTASLQQQHRVCARSFFPVFRRILRHPSDTDFNRSNLRCHRFGGIEIDSARDVHTECRHQQEGFQNFRF